MHEDDEPTGGEYRFDGLETLNGTVFPDVLLDHVMAHLTGAEFKVLAYIVRRTIGFKRDSDTISLEQICGGVKRRDRGAADAGTGLSKKTAIAALKGLRDKGVIVAHKPLNRDNLPTALALRFKHGDGGIGSDSTGSDSTGSDGIGGDGIGNGGHTGHGAGAAGPSSEPVDGDTTGQPPPPDHHRAAADADHNHQSPRDATTLLSAYRRR